MELRWGMGDVAGELEARIDSVAWSLLLHVRLTLRCASLSPSLLSSPTALLNFCAVGTFQCARWMLWNEIKGLSQRTWCTNRLLWHTNSDFYGIRTPTLTPYESFH